MKLDTLTFDISLEKIKELLANFEDKKAMFAPNEVYVADLSKFEARLNPVKKYKPNKVKTTVGRYLFNLYMNTYYTGYFYKNIGYVNKTLDAKSIGVIDDILSDCLLTKVISSEEYIDYINKRDKLSYFVCNFLGTGMTLKTVLPLKSVQEKKEQLFKKYAKEIKDKDINVVSKIENELLDDAKKELKDDVGLNVFASGSRGSFENNYKNVSIMRGALYSADGSKDLTISKDSLVEGISKDNMPSFNDLAIIGSYSKGVETQKGGYIAKQLAGSFQGFFLDKKGSDCHSHKTLKVKLDYNNFKEYYLRYILVDGKYVLLDKNNYKKYDGQIVKLRSPMFCLSKNICNVCAGELYYYLGILNIGLISNVIGTSILNLSMKKFHDSRIKTKKLIINDFINNI